MFKPMLASPVDDLNLIKFPVLVSPKLDGIRATIQDGRVYSRTLKLIPNNHVQYLFGRPELEGLDGELILGEPTAKDCFRKTTSAVMSIEGRPQIKHYVFDLHSNAPFYARFEQVRYPIKSNPNVLIVPHFDVDNLESLLEWETDFLIKGYEGLMIRSMNGPYKQGRSTLKEGYLLKLKRFLDSEAIVIGFEEKMTNDNPSVINELGYQSHSHCKDNLIPAGTLGALLVMDLKSDTEFSIGSGFDDATRQLIWNNQTFYRTKIVKYKYFPSGSKDKPRFPTFLGWRDVSDISK